MGESKWFDFEVLILTEMVKADARVLAVEKEAALKSLQDSNQKQGNPEQRFVEALQADNQSSVLETLSKVCENLPLEQKLSLLRNCWRVAISDDELHSKEEALLYDVIDRLKVSRRTFTADQQRMAG